MKHYHYWINRVLKVLVVFISELRIYFWIISAYRYEGSVLKDVKKLRIPTQNVYIDFHISTYILLKKNTIGSGSDLVVGQI